MTHVHHRGPKVWLLLPVLGAGILAACVLTVVRHRAPSVAASSVVEEIHSVALRRSQTRGIEDGGPIGTWWVTASRVDPESERLLNFRIRSGELRVAARSAKLIVDAEHDTFGFELFGAVLTRLPDASGDAGELLTLEHRVLGPVPYGVDIEPDAPTRLTVVP